MVRGVAEMGWRGAEMDSETIFSTIEEGRGCVR